MCVYVYEYVYVYICIISDMVCSIMCMGYKTVTV